MKAIQIEMWARRVIENLQAGKPNEDSLVELKREWPTDHVKAARLIAAHANTARGEPILWLIGVDQRTGEICDVDQLELSTWYEKVKSAFDDQHAPTVRDLNINYNGHTFVALLFDTERFPFVVKVRDGYLDVPWREGTLTRSAKRSELLKLLLPLQYLPQVEILSGEIKIQFGKDVTDFYWHGIIYLYIEPYNDTQLISRFIELFSHFKLKTK